MRTLSVVVITRNEQDNLAPCLDTVPFADEIVIVDDYSEDATLEVARRYTDRIFTRRLERFGRQKQFAIEQARSDWILVLDADERVTPELAEEIAAVLAADGGGTSATGPSAAEASAAGASAAGASDGDADGYYLRRLTWLHDKPVDFSGWYKCSHLRLFRRGRARYVDRRVHEYPELEDPARAARLNHEIEHFTYGSEHEYVAKLERYTRLAAEDWYDAGRRANWLSAPWYFVIVPAAAWLREFVVQKGYRGGRLGFRIACMSARADLETARQLWRVTRDRRSDAPEFY